MTSSTGDVARQLPPSYEVADLYPRSAVMADAPAVVPLEEDPGVISHPHSPIPSLPHSLLGNGSCQHKADTKDTMAVPPERSDVQAGSADGSKDDATDSFLPLLTSASDEAPRSTDPPVPVPAMDSFDSVDHQSISPFVNDNRAGVVSRATSRDEGCDERRDSGTSETKSKRVPQEARRPQSSVARPGGRGLRSTSSCPCPCPHQVHMPESASVPKKLGQLREDECASMLAAKCFSEEKLGGRKTRSSTQDSQPGSAVEEGGKADPEGGGPVYSYQNCDVILKDPRNEVKYFWIDGEVLAVPKAGAKFKKATFLARKQTLARKIFSCVLVVIVLVAIIAVVAFISLRPSS